MAVPSGMTTLNMSGKYTQNKKLTVNADENLALQGVSFLTRKAISVATMTVTMDHRVEDGVEKLTLSQVLTGGIGASSEDRLINGADAELDHPVFGKCIVMNKRVQLSEVEEPFLKDNWAGEAETHGVLFVKTTSIEKGWSSIATWGIAEVEGALRHVRRFLFTGPKGEKLETTLVFDYAGVA